MNKSEMKKTTMKNNTHTKKLRKKHNTKSKTYRKIQIQAKLNYIVYGAHKQLVKLSLRAKELLL